MSRSYHTLALVEVSEDQQSLAIGKGGQNVRLAAKLTGWKIDIRSTQGEQVATADEEGEGYTVDEEAVEVFDEEVPVPDDSMMKEGDDEMHGGEMMEGGDEMMEEDSMMEEETGTKTDATAQ